MRLEYLPVLRKALTAPLQPTADNNSGKDGIATVMDLMNAYGFSKYSLPLPHPRAPPSVPRPYVRDMRRSVQGRAFPTTC
jgi:hypothetical protein